MQVKETWSDYQTRKIKWLKLIIKGLVVIMALFMIALGTAIWKYAEAGSQNNRLQKELNITLGKLVDYEGAVGK